MGSHYTWAVKGVSGEGVDAFAARLQDTLNSLEAEEFEIYDVMDVPPAATRGVKGVAVVGRKPRRFPRHQPSPPEPSAAPSSRPNNGSAALDPGRLARHR